MVYSGIFLFHSYARMQNFKSKMLEIWEVEADGRGIENGEAGKPRKHG